MNLHQTPDPRPPADVPPPQPGKPFPGQPPPGIPVPPDVPQPGTPIVRRARAGAPERSPTPSFFHPWRPA
ncbi:hypothetical protein Bsp3421_003986 [Burkholderia sp. FERM BP-3421]|jgi:hypothetical protein|uniref:hypothetical protein n=1 Tax=Burkholderia sp. FERM BP-3421 TaxID=1494466 RepID=UPI00235F4FBE|nr:hypothetical protein [Burkholderia sp. FERM BP-3421]WDD93885.1 hypothetical protein Bsp3421_003986 [Burkholderia sp. FERM BP-3421]